MFVPAGDSPRCATYIRKCLKLDPRNSAQLENHILSINIQFSTTAMEIINIYAPSAAEANQFRATHTTHENTIISGDFNCQDNLWYTELATDLRIYNNIRNNNKHADPLLEYTSLHVFTLENTLVTFTPFPHNKNNPTIIDLTCTYNDHSELVFGRRVRWIIQLHSHSHDAEHQSPQPPPDVTSTA